MKNFQATVEELIGLAKSELVVLRQSDGWVFALTHAADFDVEVGT